MDCVSHLSSSVEPTREAAGVITGLQIFKAIVTLVLAWSGA